MSILPVLTPLSIVEIVVFLLTRLARDIRLWSIFTAVGDTDPQLSMNLDPISGGGFLKKESKEHWQSFGGDYEYCDDLLITITFFNQ